MFPHVAWRFLKYISYCTDSTSSLPSPSLYDLDMQIYSFLTRILTFFLFFSLILSTANSLLLPWTTNLIKFSKQSSDELKAFLSQLRRATLWYLKPENTTGLMKTDLSVKYLYSSETNIRAMLCLKWHTRVVYNQLQVLVHCHIRIASILSMLFHVDHDEWKADGGR